jgi:CMP/dCMP kinase
MSLIVTIDGPSGTGKSTVSRAVARAVDLPHLDTGAFYRAATLAVLEASVSPDDRPGVVGVITPIRLDQQDGITLLDGRDVSAEIREDDVSQAVSAVSAHPDVRSLLVELQREWVDRHGRRAVVEGRDIGSVVFPDAEVKVYLDARPEVRARRRALERGDDPERVARTMARRDHLDSTRQTSPLTVPEGAVVVDTSEMTFCQVVDRVIGLIAAKS